MQTLIHRSLIIIAIICIILQPARCQQQTGFAIATYDETNGLKSNIINVLMQDSKGFIWIGTTDGLYRYDGYNFKIFKGVKKDTTTLAGNYVTSLAEDKEGNIWIGLRRGGVSCYLPSKNIFKNYPANTSDNSNMLSPAVSMLYIDNSSEVWVGFNQEGLIKLDKHSKSMHRFNIIPETDTFYSKEYRQVYNTVFAMHQEKQNIYWLATYDGLYRFNSATRQMTPVRETPLQKNSSRNDLFNSIVADSSGVWLGSWAGGLTYYNIKTNTWSNYKYSKPIKNIANTNIVENIKDKNANELWLATPDAGLGVFNKTTHSFYFFSSDSTYRSQVKGIMGSALLQDDQNNLWITFDRQLIKLQFTEKKFVFNPVKVMRSDNGAYYDITCMLADRSKQYLIIGTSLADGLHIINRQTGNTQTLSFKAHDKEENSMHVVSLLQDSRGLIWVLTRDYIYQLDLAHKQLKPVPQPVQYSAENKSNVYTSICEDAKGNIWLSSSRNGIFCYDVAHETYTHFNNSAKEYHLPSNIIRSLAVDEKGRVWAGGTAGTFGYFDGKKFIQLDEFAKETSLLTDKKIYHLYADRQGNIWACTDAGLHYYTTNKEKPEWKKLYTSEDGLPGDVVYNVSEDNYGHLWCITLFSLYRINTKFPGIEIFSKLDGINTNTTGNGLYNLPDSSICLLSAGGYYNFQPGSFKEKTFNIPLAITSFKIDDKEQNFSYNDSIHTVYVIPSSANVFSFEFAALDFYRPDKQEYAYMLEGYDKEWIFAGQRRYVSYSNIPGGNYVFKVKATNNPGTWNTKIVSMHLYIKTPFYKTFWFILISITVITCSLYYTYRYKLTKQQQILQLETKAQMLGKEKTMAMYETLKQHLNPHFLFNSLTSLSSLIRYDQNKAIDFLNGLSKIYRYILKSRDAETVTLKKELEFVQYFIELQKTRFNAGLIVDINIDEQYYAYKIVPVTLQNLIENAIKHNIIAEDEPLNIAIYTEEDYLIVRNNLQKKSFVESSNHQGLHNMRSLYAYLTVKPVITTEDENYYTIKIPLV